MLILLSPAKSLNWTPVPDVPTSSPNLQSDFAVLMRQAKRLSVADLKSMMKLSDKLADLNHDRFKAMTADPDPDRDRQAILAFNGDVYKGLDARSLDVEALAWSQERVRILSGLYGVLRPLHHKAPHISHCG